MPQLYFHYGAVGSAKTLHLLAVADTYTRQGKRVLLFKPKMDTRFGDRIQSRTGMYQPALLVEFPGDIARHITPDIDCILFDEANFASVDVIEYLRELSLEIPVLAFGIRTDFLGNLFPGIKRLFELCDKVVEIKTTCKYCGKKATMNRKIANRENTEIELGCEELYIPTCYTHYN
jgi:thymidine kinase